MANTKITLKHRLEASILFAFWALCRALPLDAASAMGGWLGRRFGRYLKWHRIAHYNLSRAFPSASAAEIVRIQCEMWDNLGRSLAEMAYLTHPQLAARIELPESERQSIANTKAAGKPALFLGGHFANWELLPWAGHLIGQPMHLVYRTINNPIIEAHMRQKREQYCEGISPKGRRAARALLQCMAKNGAMGLLVDQKANDGVKLQLFGQDAMTPIIPAELAIKHDATILAVRIIRLEGCHFRLQITPQTLPETAPDLMQKMNDVIEGWAGQHPAQWLWVHQRWEKLPRGYSL